LPLGQFNLFRKNKNGKLGVVSGHFLLLSQAKILCMHISTSIKHVMWFFAVLDVRSKLKVKFSTNLPAHNNATFNAPYFVLRNNKLHYRAYNWELNKIYQTATHSVVDRHIILYLTELNFTELDFNITKETHSLLRK